MADKSTIAKGRGAPDPDHPSKPDTPRELTKPSWGYILRKTFREFLRDECTDLAAALTYYAVLSLFPALVALVSLLGVFGQGQQTIDTLLGLLRDLGAGAAVSSVEPVLQQLSTVPGAGVALVVGLLGALWSASGYVNAFGRAMNRIYEVGEGRPIWKLRPLMIVITIVLLLLVSITAVGLIVSGPVAEAIGGTIGLGSVAVTVWNIAKWPVILGVVVVIVAILYHATPNVRQPKFRWISVGAVVAILTWILASAAFGFYVANFGSYNKTYGSLAGVIVFLLWLWITNLALLFGAELDAETERGRELQAGMEAEETIQLPPRDTTKTEKDAAKEAKLAEQARELRRRNARASDSD
jgi:membrane protein